MLTVSFAMQCSAPIQSSQCDPYFNNDTSPRFTVQIIHLFVILSCPGQGKVTRNNVYDINDKDKDNVDILDGLITFG